uniref:Putative secreted protein n=1 Tax=Ixodes ricinus TaxID=34613 RepID=A0A6B0UBA1_IXORI
MGGLAGVGCLLCPSFVRAFFSVLGSQTWLGPWSLVVGVPRSSGRRCSVVGCASGDGGRRVLSGGLCGLRGVRRGGCGCSVSGLHRFPYDWK